MLAILGLAMALPATADPFLGFLRPLFTEKDLVTEPLLAGSWTNREEHDDHPLVITDVEDAEYLVDLGDWDFQLKAHLVRLGDFLFLDLTVVKAEVKSGSYTLLPPPHVTQADEGVFLVLAPSDKSDPWDSVRVEILTAHLICRVDVDAENLHVACIDEGDWTAKAVARAELAMDPNNEVVTSSTEDLRKFLLKYAHDDSLFAFRLDLHRQKAALPNTDKP